VCRREQWDSYEEKNGLEGRGKEVSNNGFRLGRIVGGMAPGITWGVGGVDPTKM
jgi:hypothetical protein